MAYLTKALDYDVVLPSDQEAAGRTLSEEEKAALSAVIDCGVLTSTKGNFVREFERDFARLLNTGFAHACSSGTAAIHAAVAALDPEPGDEFITSAITDMGALTPILYQGAIPVFAEVDRYSLNVTAETIAPLINSRTKGIIVTHLFGNPCHMSGILEIAAERGIPVIEDCAQAFLAEHKGRYVGTWGRIGCFSTQQGKHITTGEGGVLVSDDPALARRMFLFLNKAWGYGDAQPDHYFLALNYRMSELQGAVAKAQLPKLESVVARRRSAAARLDAKLKGLPGLTLPAASGGDVHSYWKYPVAVDSAKIRGGAVALAGLLRERGISSAPRYIQKPAFECAVFKNQKTFGNSRFPFTLARPEALDYSRGRFPETLAALEHILVLPWNENYTEQHVDFIANAIADAVKTHAL